MEAHSKSFLDTFVIDTGVLISAFLKPKSIPAQALERARTQYTLVASIETMMELATVISRDYLAKYRTVDEREEFLGRYSELVELIPITTQVTDCRDAKDNKFLELALSAQAPIIVSSDSDLLVLHPYQGINVYLPGDFLLFI
jgi:putative PIN family toxin of toxin-antitoxin system